MLLICLFLMTLADLGCGFDQSAPQLLLLSFWVRNTSLKAPKQINAEVSRDEETRGEAQHPSSCVDGRLTELEVGNIKEKSKT